MRETSASKLWKEIEDKFMKKSTENKLYTRTKLYRFQYKPGTTMNDHITKFGSLVTDLLNLDEKVSDVDKALILLASLPDEYEHLIVSMLIGKETITFKEVTTALYSNEIRKKDKLEHRSSAGEVHTVRGRNQSRKPGRRGRSQSKGKLAKDEYAFCHEKGHWKKDCPKLQKKKGKGVSEACVAEDDKSDFSLACVSSVTSTDEWLCDSACSFHMCFRKECFFNFIELDGGVVYLADNKPCKIAGIGSISLKNHDGSTRVLTDVPYIPKLEKNLISLGTLESKGFNIIMQNGILKVVSRALVVMKGIRRNNLYLYQGSTALGTAAAVTEADKVAEMSSLWHMRHGHAGEKYLQTLAIQGLLKGAKTCKLDFCEQCVLGKQKRVKFGTTIHNTKGILDYIHTDVWGPTKTASLGGKHYFVTFVDDFSRRVWVYTMKSKDEVFETFLVWKKMVENQTGRKIKVLRYDNGTEYQNDQFSIFCKKEGISRHFTVRDTPQQNGVAERMNRTLLEKVRCMLSNAGFGKQFLVEAVMYASHLINRLPSAALNGKTPLEVWSGKPINDYDTLHVFGSTAYYHVKESKLDPRAKKSLFMGVTLGVKGYRLWCLSSKKIISSRDVTFDESSMLKKVTTYGKVSENTFQQPEGRPPQVEGTQKLVEFQTTSVKPVEDQQTEHEADVGEEEVSNEEPQQQHDLPIAISRPRREIRKPARFEDMVAYAFPVVEEGIPHTFLEANSSPDKEKWKKAMDEGMQSLVKNHTWKLARLPKGNKAIGCKWVYAQKEGFPRKNDVRYKARLAAKGYAQKEGIDYNEVFSPVVKHSSIRILLALVAQFNMKLVQMDVKTAFLHGDLEEEIYITQPDGFKVAGKENWVCELSKSLYGLKQSPRLWYKRFDQFMIGHNYTRKQF